MRLHRFYTDNPIKESAFDVADRDMVHQWKSVFRYNVGSQVILFDGSGTDYLCVISSLRNLGATLEVVKKNEIEVPNKNIYLCVALIKKDNLELVVQKATEIGVNHIIPVICEHSEKRKLNMDRMRKIAKESTEQSGRGVIPTIHPITNIQDLFNSGILPQEKIVFHPDGVPFRQWWSGVSINSIAVFVGPEGGFSPKEIALFKSFNVPAITLGSRILRAETAAITASSLLLF